MPKLVQCPNGHFYDAERSEQCPYCDRPNSPMPPDCPGKEEFMRRLAEQEAARERGVTAEIPPVDGPAAGKTVPLREEGAGKTRPLDGAGTGRTQPLDEAPVAPPPPMRKAGWQRMLLLAAAGLAAACTLFSLLDLMRWLLR